MRARRASLKPRREAAVRAIDSSAENLSEYLNSETAEVLADWDK